MTRLLVVSAFTQTKLVARLFSSYLFLKRRNQGVNDTQIRLQDHTLYTVHTLYTLLRFEMSQKVDAFASYRDRSDASRCAPPSCFYTWPNRIICCGSMT